MGQVEECDVVGKVYSAGTHNCQALVCELVKQNIVEDSELEDPVELNKLPNSVKKFIFALTAGCFVGAAAASLTVPLHAFAPVHLAGFGGHATGAGGVGGVSAAAVAGVIAGVSAPSGLVIGGVFLLGSGTTFFLVMNYCTQEQLEKIEKLAKHGLEAMEDSLGSVAIKKLVGSEVERVERCVGLVHHSALQPR